MRLRLIIPLVLAAVTISGSAYGACNLGQDAPQITALEFGRMRISNFAAGSLVVSNHEALSNADRWHFTLRPSDNTVSIRINNPTTVARQALRLEGALKLKRSIQGSITERLSSSGCERSITLAQDTLEGGEFAVRYGVLANAFGGTLTVTRGTLQIASHTEITDRVGSVEGTIVATTTQARVQGARVRLPTLTDVYLPLNLAQQPQTHARLEIKLSAIGAQFIDAHLLGDAFSVAPSPAAEITLAGLRSTMTSLEGEKIAVTFQNREPSVDMQDVTMVASSLQHDEVPRVRATALQPIKVQQVQAASAIAQGVLNFRANTVTVRGLNAVAANIVLLAPNRQVILEGAGRIAIDSLSAAAVKGAVQLTKPRLNGTLDLTLAAQIETLTLSAEGKKASLEIKGTGTASLLNLGGMRVQAARLPFSVAMNAAGPAVAFNKVQAQITLGRDGLPQLRGEAQDFQMEGVLKGLDDPQNAVFDVPANALSATLNLSQASVAALGGAITFPKTVKIVAAEGLTIGKIAISQRLDLIVANLTLSGLQLKPQPVALPMPIQNAAVSVAPQSVKFQLSRTENAPLQIVAKFDLPGFELTPQSPATSVSFDVGNLKVEVNSFKVEKVWVAFDAARAEVHLMGVAVQLGPFEPVSPDAGQPNLRGLADSPFTIAEAHVQLAFNGQPLEMATFGLENGSFSSKQIVYQTPEGAQIDASTALLRFKTISKTYVELSLKLAAARAEWVAAPNGIAAIESIGLDLLGSPQSPDGAISLSASRVALSGRVNLPIGTKPDGSHGCSIVLPANGNLTITDVTGKLPIAGGVVKGFLSAGGAEVGHVQYAGGERCHFDQPVVLRLPHPCIPQVWKKCTSDVHVGDVRIGFAVVAFDVYMQPAQIRVKLNDKKFSVCHWAVDKLVPVVPPIWSLAPEINAGGLVGDFINRLLSVPFGQIQSIFAGTMMDLYAAMSFVGFGLNNPLHDDCS